MYVLEAQGYDVSLNDEDKKKIERGEDLRTTIPSERFGSTCFIFRVRKYAEPDADQLKFDWYEHPPNPWMRQYMTEPGFWIEVYPFSRENVGGFFSNDERRRFEEGLEDCGSEGLEHRDKLILTIDEERWRRLCSEGAIHTRCLYDRVDVSLHAKGVMNSS